ncbi:MAG TPA: hypothetical protein VFF96_00225, partial [Pseudoxanthomonas sp.]|nr:hypothetical protein [Pseudoxanthomonas sp.]
MIVLEGQSALSPFRRARLESKLQSLVPGVRIAGAWHVYFVEAEPGAAVDETALRRILQASERPAASDPGAVSRFVVPRLGTLSPWSSKASELVRGAGQPVSRV